METYLIKHTKIINENKTTYSDILIKNGRLHKIAPSISLNENHVEINGENHLTIPGIIDDQVHFREPGLTHKAEIYTEAKAAVAGGVTSFMEMPNVVPQTLTQRLLQEKYNIGKHRSLANYSFFMGASNDNLDEVLKTDEQEVCGVKVFMGSSTGNMLVDDEKTLENIFSRVPMLIATHCEDEETIQANLNHAMDQFGEDIPFDQHPLIRSEDACFISSSRAGSLAKKHGTRLHVLHISTAKEATAFNNNVPLQHKKITTEACIHHLWFTDADYAEKGALIKWNPAIKQRSDRDMLWKTLLEDKIDIIATDHAPHTLAEKSNKYLNAPSGGPLVQHGLPAMLTLYHEGRLSLEKIVEKMSHAPAECFKIKERGFIREGYFADLAMIDVDKKWTVSKDNILYKCGWSPFEGTNFKGHVEKTFVSGHLAYDRGGFNENRMGHRLGFRGHH